MTPAEQAQKAEEIYNKAIAELEELFKERQEIVKEYIKELEVQKISAIRKSLESLSNNQQTP